MGDWTMPCDCCGKTIKKIRNEDYTFTSQNFNGTQHEKHYKIWVASVASFAHYAEPFQKIDPQTKLSEMTMADLDTMLEFKLNLKFGQFFHGQSGFREIWLPPKKFVHNDIDYYISGNIDGVENGTLIELKTTWVSSKTKMEGVLERAQTQADLYAWVGNFEKAKIIIKNLAKPKLDTTVQYTPNTSNVESILATYIEENKDSIKQY